MFLGAEIKKEAKEQGKWHRSRAGRHGTRTGEIESKQEAWEQENRKRSIKEKRGKGTGAEMGCRSQHRMYEHCFFKKSNGIC